MYLSKLELHGFKSFADRTVIQFSPGITSVVGPNGCGKSNIVDAVRWVIGEQRARILRSDKMDNVIFNGTASRRALGMSEVLLTIENSRGILPVEYSEVTLGRRLFRTGDSEYLLNGVQCRLKDITDLFMDTGMGAGAYSVIELKMIEDLLSDNAQDRRHLFEEAAGITKYKVRRTQTLRKLEGTQVDLTRVRDLTDELERRVGSLERQAQKATRYRRYHDELQGFETALAQGEFDRIAGQRDEIREGLAIVRDRLEEEGAALATAEASYEARRTEQIEKERTLVDAQTVLGAHLEELRQLESDERVARERLSVAERDLTRLAEEARQAEISRIDLEEARIRFSEAVEQAVPEAETADGVLKAAGLERDTASTELDALRKRLDVLRATERDASARQAEMQRSRDRITGRLETLRADLSAVENGIPMLRDAVAESGRAVDAASSEATDRRAERDRLVSALDDAISTRATRAADLDAALLQLRETQRRHDAIAAEAALLESLLSSFDDFTEPVRFLASDDEWSSSPLETVADVLACDPEHRAALEAAVGEYADCLVIGTDDEARRAIGRLRSERKGRATFLVLDRLGQSSAFFAPTESAGGDLPPEARPLRDFVRVSSPELEPLASALLHDCWLVDDLEEVLSASSSSNSHRRFFASSGEWGAAPGFVHAGSDSAGSSAAAGRIGRREQLATVVVQLETAAADVRAAEERTIAARKAHDAIDVAGLEGSLRASERAHAASGSDRARATAAFDAASARLREQEDRLAHLQAALAESEGAIEVQRTALSSVDADVQQGREARTEAESIFAAAETRYREAVQQFSDTQVEALQARNRMEQARRELDRTVERIEALAAQKLDRDRSLERLTADRMQATTLIESLGSTISEKRIERAGFEQTVSLAKDEMATSRVGISEIEAELREHRRRREQSMKEESQLAVREAELQTRAEDLVASIEEDYGLDLTIERFEIPADFDADTARETVHTLRTRIRNLGPVNALALESFEEEKARLDFMQTQLRDLESAEETLLETINEINTTASERFMTTFDLIRANFSKLFTQLFGEEASAEILLESPDDPLESIIEIMAKPHGKRPSVLAQLSGGEKTLTAIALLFAIYLVKPSPFCILDEVDAPLDDANVDRFMDLIRSFADSTQFVLVTHNKRTMEAADRMYGITMQEQGVSRLVGVAFDEQPELRAVSVG